MANFFSPLSDFFFWILRFLHENLGVSWAWSIVLLTVIVRIVMVPLTWRQIKSTRAMQALQPQLKALQEKYKDNREVLNQKIMEFYRENNVSPFGSCLPLLLQLPVFLGLFYMLRSAGLPAGPDNASNAAGAFLDPVVGWLWIGDITKFNLPLMFLYIASQFAASWQMARKASGQQRYIAWLMPVIVGVFMFIYKWPAGLMIYWFTSNLWTIAQQFVAEKFMPIHVPVAATPGKEKSPSGKSAGKPSGAPTGKSRPTASGKAPSKTGSKAPKASVGKAQGGSAGKSGGKTSGQKAGQQGKATGSKGQRPNRGTGRPKGSGGA